MTDESIRALARRAGIAVDWTDVTGKTQHVDVPVLESVLTALGLPCASAHDLAESRHQLAQQQTTRPMLTTTVGSATSLPGPAYSGPAEIALEDGTVAPVRLKVGDTGLIVPPIRIAGYHRLRFADREVALAVAPKRCVTVEDIAPGRKIWGLMAQIYSLRREGDCGIGDSGALAALAEVAARKGADAITLSPAHALFPSAPERYGPYSPSSRLFLNPLLADPAAVFGATETGTTTEDHSGLIDWPRSSRAKYAVLRRLYDSFTDERLVRDFEAFVVEGGARLAGHAQFEAGQESEPDGVRYHLFQQWVAARAFASAQERARAAGMKIGLITDLAVGIDRSGSEAATRPQDLLNGLKIGAPPDAFNPKGQDWGLTSFSPRSLVASGFEPFIAMVRAALANAGGVRIDHAMGLMRLWLIPDGADAPQGAYLSYPLDDLLRLLALESHRHRAIVIGEDLGTVPPEFRRHCRSAGIAGMDVLWFQRDGRKFLPPRKWRPDAVAMTTTHDLSTVAGWWKQSADTDRTALWSAFTAAGVVRGEAPAPASPAAAVDAAIGFVAEAPAPLALIPLEDIVGTTEQPNVPGTLDEHPNWRHRFDLPAEELLARPEAAGRLDILRKARP